ncbi:hypothetical protein UYSO10_4660 [Kosakonia radicincitans]|nr:hypothetical protein UYSO10_4660 [Kosakonia radicincitans]
MPAAVKCTPTLLSSRRGFFVYSASNDRHPLVRGNQLWLSRTLK